MCGESNSPSEKECTSCGEPLAGNQNANSEGIWRDGNILIMRKTAVLPDRCVKTNEPAVSRLKRNLSWHSQWVMLLVLISPLIYIIVAMIVRQTAKIEIGLGQTWVRRRTRGILGIVFTLVLGIALFFGGVFLIDSPQHSNVGLALILSGIFGGLITILILNWWISTVSPKEITKHLVYLKGVCPEFLDEFPEFEGA